MASFQKTMREVEAMVAEFNRLTGRPSRAYEPSDAPYPPANVGYAYARCLGEQEGNRLVVSVIISPGGGVTNIYGLSGSAAEVSRTLRKKLADPAWVKVNQFDGGRVDRDLAVVNRLHAPPKESVTGAFLESLSEINQQ